MAVDVKQYLKAAGGFSAAVVMAAGLVVNWEGKVTTTYLDPVGVPTACYGHTGPELKLGQNFTDDQCLKLLGDDLKKHDAQLLSKVKVPMNDYIHASLLDFTYNVGIGNLQSSTLLIYLNQHRYKEACQELTKWVYAKKQKLRGLVLRREAEMDMCLQGV